MADRTGIGLLYNATPHTIIEIGVGESSPVARSVSVAPLALYDATKPAGCSPLSGYSFPIPPGGDFIVIIRFDTGDRVAASFRTGSVAAPAVYILALLNALIMVKPGGTASDIALNQALSSDAAQPWGKEP